MFHSLQDCQEALMAMITMVKEWQQQNDGRIIDNEMAKQRQRQGFCNGNMMTLTLANRDRGKALTAMTMQ